VSDARSRDEDGEVRDPPTAPSEASTAREEPCRGLAVPGRRGGIDSV